MERSFSGSIFAWRPQVRTAPLDPIYIATPEAFTTGARWPLPQRSAPPADVEPPRPAPVLRAAFGSGFLISMLPLNKAPSSMLMRAVMMSPTSFASLRISTLSRGLHVALHLAEDDDLPGPNAGLNTAVRPDRYFILLRFDGSFDIAIDIEIFLGENLANDFDRFADRCGIPRFCFGCPERC